MGRKSKGVIKIKEAYCIEYAEVAKLGLIHKHPYSVEKGIVLRMGNTIEVPSIEGTYNLISQTNLLRIYYVAWSEDGIPNYVENVITIEHNPSNLRVGRVGYFICPVSGRRCRKLYKNDKSNIWQCRKAFTERLYYPLQLCSKMQSYATKFRAYNHWINKYSETNIIKQRSDTPTKKYLLVSKLKKKQSHMQMLSFSPLSVPIAIRKLLPYGLVDDYKRLFG